RVVGVERQRGIHAAGCRNNHEVGVGEKVERHREDRGGSVARIRLSACLARNCHASPLRAVYLHGALRQFEMRHCGGAPPIRTSGVSALPSAIAISPSTARLICPLGRCSAMPATFTPDRMSARSSSP
ncbi:MAG: hypothetical protein ACK55I_23220, partial [bacterium]